MLRDKPIVLTGAGLRRSSKSLLILTVLALSVIALPSSELRGQSDYAPATPQDSAKVDSAAPPKNKLQQAIEEGERAAQELEADTAGRAASRLPADQQSVEQRAVANAQDWVHLLLFRGWLNPTLIGGYATYQLTAWGEGTGSYGPVDGKLTIQYLGSTEWLGHDAEWLQAAYYTMESEPELIEFDLIVPAMQRITEVYRAYCRIDRGDLQPVSFAVTAGQTDLEASDVLVESGPKSVRIYAGSFDCTAYRGTGEVGADVIVYRSASVSPLEVVVLGYGDEGLTYSSGGAEVTPRFKSPPPPPR
jgi:hypothetical protein